MIVPGSAAVGALNVVQELGHFRKTMLSTCPPSGAVMLPLL